MNNINIKATPLRITLTELYTNLLKVYSSLFKVVVQRNKGNLHGSVDLGNSIPFEILPLHPRISGIHWGIIGELYQYFI